MEQTFENYLASAAANISSYQFIANLLLTAVLAVLLAWVYARYGNSLSNRKDFSKNFIVISMTTMFVITIVKSSLALSLGLVGALSIVRFRAAIKEPEELGFLFLAIAIGLGLGANQVEITLIAIAVILAVIVAIRLKGGKIYNENNLHLVFRSSEPGQLSIGEVLETLKNNCDAIDLKRFDETPTSFEASFLVEIRNVEQIGAIRAELNLLGKDVSITFLDNKGLI